MEIKEGYFYFIKDEFFEKFSNYDLMQNKENGNKRPCYFCFRDKYNSKIIWFVPISSKVEKYKKIYENKTKTRRQVYNFVFGQVMGVEKVFLIQNIFPTTEEYILEKYIMNGEEVNISRVLKRQVIEASQKVIKLAKRGVNIPFYDIISLKNTLEKTT